MKLNRKQLNRIILKEIRSLFEQDQKKGPPYDKYRDEEIGRVFGQAAWEDYDSSESLMRQVGPDAYESLAKFIKGNPEWKKWYESQADDGTGGTA